MVSYGNALQLGNSVAGFELAGNGLGSTIPTDLDAVTSTNQAFQTSAYSTQDIAYSFHTANNSQLTQVQFPLYHNETFNPTFDPPMSFRDRHRFLDGIYNSSPDPDAISVKDFKNISNRAGLSMEEVLSWFEDEKGRRSKLIARKDPRMQETGSQFPLSPADTTSPPQNSTVTLCMSQYTPLCPSDSFGKLDDIFSPAAIPLTPRFAVPEKAKRGRPTRSSSGSQAPSLTPVAKRQKQSITYPCPDCKKVYAADRWAEHVKRVHFPDQVWECQKINPRTGKPCGYGPASRADNFGTHLRTEHNSDETEIAHLKEVSKFRVVNFFHHVCGFCGETDALTTRDESIEHIKVHFKEVSSRTEVPADKGISEWTEQCGNPHILTRGVHYKFDKESDPDFDAPGEDDDTGDGNGSSEGNREDSQNKSQNSSDQGPSSADDNTFTDGTNLYSSQNSSFSKYGQSSTCFAAFTSLMKHSSFGLEGLDLPFTPIRKLGSGGHGSVDEVVSASSKEHFARKSVTRMRMTVAKSTRMAHLKNELTILKQLNHPNLVKLIGAYTDEQYSHLIMSPVADQNLADFMRMPKENQPSRFLEWMSDLSSAMAYLHDQKVKHLDVKPQNILVKGPKILLADFGTAESLFKDHSGDSKSIAVTPMYCAPETIQHGQQDYPADIFSLGCVFSEMLTCHFGKPLHEFEQVRSKDRNKPFHLTLSETHTWIQNLLDYQTPNLLLQLAQKIIHMLAEMPACRLLANELRLFSSNSCTSASSNEGSQFHVDSKSRSNSMQTKALAMAEDTLQAKPPTSQVPLHDEMRVDVRENDKNNVFGSTDDASSLFMQLGQATCQLPQVHCQLPQDHCQTILGDTDLQNYKHKERSSEQDASLFPNDAQHENQVADLTSRAWPVALSDKAPSLSSSLGTGKEWMSRFTDFSLNSSITREFLESPPLEYSFQPLALSSDGLDDLQLYPGYPPCDFVDPSILHPSYSNRPLPTMGKLYQRFSMNTTSQFPARSSPAPYSFCFENDATGYSAYPPNSRISSLPSLSSSSSSYESWASEKSREKGRCTYPQCGKIFRDLKGHMFTHQSERPEKCPIQTCDYHIKGFARKYDKNRHTLTHYKGTMVCGFCPGSGSAAEKSFSRADVFKRHLTSVHAVEQSLPNSRKKSYLVSQAPRKFTGYAPDATGKCSTCNLTFSSAQDFYEHLDDCVLRIVQQEEPAEAINAVRLAEVEPACKVYSALAVNNLPAIAIPAYSGDKDQEEEEENVENEQAKLLRAKLSGYHNSSRYNTAALEPGKPAVNAAVLCRNEL